MITFALTTDQAIVEAAASLYERAREAAAKSSAKHLPERVREALEAQLTLTIALGRIKPTRAYHVGEWTYSVDAWGELWRRPSPKPTRTPRRFVQEEGDSE